MMKRSFGWVCMVFLCLGLTACSGQKNSDPETWIFMLNGTLYYGTDETGPMGDSGCVGGEIQSTVEDGEIPTENEQSNFGAVGNPYTRDDGDGWIMVSIGEAWYCFYAEGEKEEEGEFAGFLKQVNGDTIYVDVMEYITGEDKERIAELELTEDDLLEGYYIHNPKQNIIFLYLDENTVYSFIDWGRDFVDEDAGDIRYTTTKKKDFIKYLSTYKNSKPRMPFFFETEDGIVKRIYEKPMA